jgi:hypothetical protein
MGKIKWSDPELIDLSGRWAYGNCIGNGSIATAISSDPNCDSGFSASGPSCTGSGLDASNGNCSDFGTTASGCTHNGSFPTT